MIKRVATSDLTFGHMPAPPIGVSGQVDSLGISEMLEYFTDGGVAADPETLSPIAVVGVTYSSHVTRVYIHNSVFHRPHLQSLLEYTMLVSSEWHADHISWQEDFVVMNFQQWKI